MCVRQIPITRRRERFAYSALPQTGNCNRTEAHDQQQNQQTCTTRARSERALQLGQEWGASSRWHGKKQIVWNTRGVVLWPV